MLVVVFALGRRSPKWTTARRVRVGRAIYKLDYCKISLKRPALHNEQVKRPAWKNVELVHQGLPAALQEDAELCNQTFSKAQQRPGGL